MDDNEVAVEPVNHSSSALDSLSSRVSWDPASPGGVETRSKRLIQVDEERLEYKPTELSIFLGLVWTIVGLTIPAIIAKQQSSMGVLIFGIAFAVVGAYGLYSMTAPIVFDRKKKIFIKGRGVAAESPATSSRAVYIPLEKIHAIQLLTKSIVLSKKRARQSKQRSRQIYELNLVLEDAIRIHVVDLPELDEIRLDAETISRFIGKPIWESQS